MEIFVASTPDALILGEGILGYVNCFQHEDIQPVLSQYNLVDVKADQWYPHQMMLNVLRDISEGKTNITQSFVSIGMKIIELTTFPPEISSSDDPVYAVLESISAIYRLHHRNTTEKGWVINKLGPLHFQAKHDTPYPNELAYGVVWGCCKRFTPEGLRFSIKPIEESDWNYNAGYDVILKDVSNQV